MLHEQKHQSKFYTFTNKNEFSGMCLKIKFGVESSLKDMKIEQHIKHCGIIHSFFLKKAQTHMSN